VPKDATLEVIRRDNDATQTDFALVLRLTIADEKTWLAERRKADPGLKSDPDWLGGTHRLCLVNPDGQKAVVSFTIKAKPMTPASGSESSYRTVAASSTKVMELQNLLLEYAGLLPEGRLRAAVNPGGADGVMGESTIAAVDNFLSLLDPPDRFDDLAEPRVDTVIAVLRREIAARRARNISS
jgi:hypothetical protein